MKKTKIELLSPENLNEITLSQYQEFLALGRFETVDGKQEYISEATEDDILKIFLRLDQTIINKIPTRDVTRISNYVLNIMAEGNKNPPDLKRKFVYKGKRWGFIPKLDDISWDESNSAGKFLADWEDMNKAMAVLYRPITYEKRGKYLIEDYKGFQEYADELKDMPLSVVLGANFFLSSLQRDLLNSIPNSILQHLTKEQQDQMVSLELGETTTKYTLSVRAILEGLPKLQSTDFTLS